MQATGLGRLTLQPSQPIRAHCDHTSQEILLHRISSWRLNRIREEPPLFTPQLPGMGSMGGGTTLLCPCMDSVKRFHDNEPRHPPTHRPSMHCIRVIVSSNFPLDGELLEACTLARDGTGLSRLEAQWVGG